MSNWKEKISEQISDIRKRAWKTFYQTFTAGIPVIAATISLADIQAGDYAAVKVALFNLALSSLAATISAVGNSTKVIKGYDL